MVIRGAHRNIIQTSITAVLLCLFTDNHAQFFKSRKNKDQPAYAYQTFSTTQPKERRNGYAGGEAKFRFEKPLFPVPYEKNDRMYDYSKSPFFGHKRPPRRNGNGVMRLCKVCGIKHF